MDEEGIKEVEADLVEFSCGGTVNILNSSWEDWIPIQTEKRLLCEIKAKHI
jgi:hypothetical protein